MTTLVYFSQQHPQQQHRTNKTKQTNSLKSIASKPTGRPADNSPKRPPPRTHLLCALFCCCLPSACLPVLFRRPRPPGLWCAKHAWMCTGSMLCTVECSVCFGSLFTDAKTPSSSLRLNCLLAPVCFVLLGVLLAGLLCCWLVLVVARLPCDASACGVVLRQVDRGAGFVLLSGCVEGTLGKAGVLVM